MEDDNVDAIVTGLVREYLYRKGLTEVLRIFDEETGARETSINATSDLVKHLHLVKLYRKNQTSDAPLPSVLEVLTSYFFKGLTPENDSSSTSNSSSSSSSHGLPSSKTEQTSTVDAVEMDKGTNDNGTLLSIPETNTDEALVVSTIISSLDNNNNMPNSTSTSDRNSSPSPSVPVEGMLPIKNSTASNESLTTVPSVVVPLLPTETNKPVVSSEGGFFARLAAHKATTEANTSATTSFISSTETTTTVIHPPMVPMIPSTTVPLTITSSSNVSVATSSNASVLPSTGNSFWDRINANKAATTEGTMTMTIPTIPSSSSSTENIVPVPPSVRIIPTTVKDEVPLTILSSNVNTNNLGTSTTTVSSVTTSVGNSNNTGGGGGGGFWDRINANKTVPSSSSSTSSISLPPTVPPVSSSTITTSSSTETSSTTVDNSGGFWSRINSNKTNSIPSSSTTDTTVVSSTSSTSTAPNVPTVPIPTTVKSTTSGTVFTAPDGKTFTDRNQYRQYMFTTFYTFSQRSNETLTKLPGDIAGQPFNIEDCTNCTIRLCDYSETVQVDRVQNCHIFIGACCESVFLRNITNCTVTLACKQLRTRDCSNCTIFLYSKTDPIIEASYSMRFAPFNGSYPGLDKHMKAANLDPKFNHWKRIFDFSTDNTTLPVPHWEYFNMTEYKEWIINDLPGYENKPCINPVPLDSAPREEPSASSSNTVGPSTSNSMLSFDIRNTSQSTAEAALGSQTTNNTGIGNNASVANGTTKINGGGGGGFFARLAASKTNQNISKYSA